MIYYVDQNTGEITRTDRQALEGAILEASDQYTAAELSRMKVNDLEPIAAKFPQLDGYCFSRSEAESLAEAYRPRRAED